jgi:hypothetical protein
VHSSPCSLLVHDTVTYRLRLPRSATFDHRGRPVRRTRPRADPAELRALLPQPWHRIELNNPTMAPNTLRDSTLAFVLLRGASSMETGPLTTGFCSYILNWTAVVLQSAQRRYLSAPLSDWPTT